MNIDNIKKFNDNLYVYKTEDFATVKIKYSFSFENTKENYIKARIIGLYLERINSKYKNHKDINDKCRELYGLRLSIVPEIIGSKYFLSYSIELPSPNAVQDDYFEDAVDFFKDMMLYPYFPENKLDDRTFLEVKKEIKDLEKNIFKDPNKMQKRLFLHAIAPDSIMNNYFTVNLEEFLKIVDNITDTEIIDFYNTTMKNFVASYVFGNLRDEEIELIGNSINLKKIKLDTNYAIIQKLENSSSEIVSSDTTQSYLYVVFEIRDFDLDRKYIYKTIGYMLNSSMAGLCLSILRGKLNIVYHAFGEFMNMRGLLCICAQIDKSNKNSALDGIDEIFEKLHDRNEVERLLDYAKEKQNQKLYTDYENFNANITELEAFVYHIAISSNKEIKLINNLTVDDIIRQVENFEKKYIFFYKGDKDAQ